MKKNYFLPVLTLGHFGVDLACLYFYFTNFPQSGLAKVISAALLYNFLAFAMQAPIGYFFDRFPAKRSTTIGILFILGGFFLGMWHLRITGLVLCGFGNAFYHVSGSIGIARADKKGLRDSGVFVSTGALGVSLGTYLASGYALPKGFFSKETVWILLLLIALLLLQRMVDSPIRETAHTFPARTKAVLLLLSLFAVFIRSFGGLFFPASYKELFTSSEYTALTLFHTVMASGIVAFLGKFLGGFLSILNTRLLHKLLPDTDIDLRTGNYIFGAATLLLSVLLLTFAGHIPFLCFLGILCFHAAMPVTLFELYCILPDHPGFAMGLSTVMLFLGYLPHEFFSLSTLPAPIILFALSLLATTCMVLSLWVYLHANHAHNKGGLV
ncbi:MAG: hypothetical protein J6K15_01020 [Lachnospiraceae bacterium]|nr:hypothetical protein [Lachnospiraceae bacterium]